MTNVHKKFTFESANKEKSWFTEFIDKIGPQPKEKITYVQRYQYYDQNVHEKENEIPALDSTVVSYKT